MPRRYYARLSSDEFRIKLEKIRNSTDNVEFEIRIRGRIWPQSSNSTKVDGRIWLYMDQTNRIWPQKRPKRPQKRPKRPQKMPKWPKIG